MNFNKVTTALLIAQVQSAPSPLGTATNFPFYATGVTASSDYAASSTTNNNGQIKTAFLTNGASAASGGIRAFRTPETFFVVEQNVQGGYTPANGSYTLSAIAAHATGHRTFYQTDSTKLGTNCDSTVVVGQSGSYPTSQATSAAYVTTNNACGGQIYQACLASLTAADYLKCQAGTAIAFGAANTNAPAIETIAKKFAVGKNLQTAGAAAVAAGNANNYNVMTNLIQSQIFDNEILMASFYHSAYAAAADVSASTGVKWCTVFNNEVDAAVVDLKAVKGFDGHSKCTWQISAKDGLKSVGFILKESEVVDYFIHFIEWQKTSAFSANQILPVADGQSYYIGAYPTTGGLFLNPAPTDLAQTADTTWKAAGAYSFYESADPSKVFVGDTQPLNFFPNSEGSQKTTQSLTVDFGLVSYVNKGRQAEISSWNSLKDSYEGKKKAYNQAIDDETARRADLFKALFEAPIEIPERPCPPTAMGSFSTWTSDLTTFSPSAASATTWDHTNAKNMFNMVNYKAYARGWLEASSDKGDKTKMYADVGKVFGVFGRGTANTPDGAKAFTWNKPAAADKSGIQISIYPETDATAGLTAAAKYIHFQAKTVEFAGMADALPSVASPAAPGAPNAALGAQTLAAGMIAIASVYASLY